MFKKVRHMMVMMEVVVFISLAIILGMTSKNVGAAAPKRVYLLEKESKKIITGNNISKWSSSNKKIATVTSKGKVTGKKTGTVTITARTAKKKKLLYKVKVERPVLTKKNMVLNAGRGEEKLSLKGCSQKVTWSTSNKKIATVTQKGVVKGVRSGKTVISARVGSKLIADCKVIVETPVVKYGSTEIDPNTGSVFEWTGESGKLKVTGTKSKVQFSVQDAEIATVRPNGTLEAKKDGNTQIILKVNDDVYYIDLYVRRPSLDGFQGKKLIIDQDDYATVAVDTFSMKDIKMVSDNQSVVQIDGCNIVPISKGTANVTFSFRGEFYVLHVCVK